MDISFIYLGQFCDGLKIFLLAGGIVLAMIVLIVAMLIIYDLPKYETSVKMTKCVIIGAVISICMFFSIGFVPSKEYIYMQGISDIIKQSGGEYTEEEIYSVLRQLSNAAAQI